jgi:hypothetical protein
VRVVIRTPINSCCRMAVAPRTRGPFRFPATRPMKMTMLADHHEGYDGGAWCRGRRRTPFEYARGESSSVPGLRSDRLGLGVSASKCGLSG